MTAYSSVDPTTGRALREFPPLSDTDARKALERSAQAYRAWHRVGLAERCALLRRVADLHRQEAVDLAKLMTLETGKPLAQALGEVELAASIYEYYGTEGAELLRDEEIDIPDAGRAVVKTAPIGPLLGIMPWNFPYYQVARFVAPNLLLGNTILLKHARNCPQEAERIGELMGAAGVPEGVYQNLFATRDQIAAMIESPLLQGVSLTGSEGAGAVVGELAGRNLKKCVLELGGSDPFIVLPGADMDKAIGAAVNGRFRNAGQQCSSSKRFIIHSSLWDEFVERFVAASAEWEAGDPMSEETRLGPMSTVQGRDELAEQVADAVSRGAVVHLGAAVPDGPGAYYPATVLSGVTPAMRAYHEELFGPVAVLHRVDSTEEAIRVANDSPFGLGGAVFTEDADEAAAVADELEVGMVGVNTTVKSAPQLPFGGVKKSGIGRELGRYGLNEFSNKKLVRTI